MKFDYVIGNPPYQESYNGESSGAKSVYDKFLDNAYEISDKVEMIHPARFLFNAGSTSKEWNTKMLSDSHFKVLTYYTDSRNVFPSLSIPITGGIVISYRDYSKQFNAIGTFTQFKELNTILNKVQRNKDYASLSNCIVSSFAYHFTAIMHNEHPDAKNRMSRGHSLDLTSNIFERLPELFHKEKPDDNYTYISVIGRLNNNRVHRFIRKDYINNVINLNKYKLILGKADGASGSIGFPIPARIIGMPAIEKPYVATTQSFMSIGAFDTEIEAQFAKKYIQSKFARCMLGILKVTQDATPPKWKYVPLQDFTENSDIDWSVSIRDIDQQLYKKYGLSAEEIDFIETHVKEME